MLCNMLINPKQKKHCACNLFVAHCKDAAACLLAITSHAQSQGKLFECTLAKRVTPGGERRMSASRTKEEDKKNMLAQCSLDLVRSGPAHVACQSPRNRHKLQRREEVRLARSTPLLLPSPLLAFQPSLIPTSVNVVLPPNLIQTCSATDPCLVSHVSRIQRLACPLVPSVPTTAPPRCQQCHSCVHERHWPGLQLSTVPNQLWRIIRIPSRSNTRMRFTESSNRPFSVQPAVVRICVSSSIVPFPPPSTSLVMSSNPTSTGSLTRLEPTAIRGELWIACTGTSVSTSVYCA